MGLLSTSSLSERRARRKERSAQGETNMRDRGAVMIEAIVVLPLLILLVFGISEFGFVFRSTITIASTTRSAARVSSNVANARGADYETLNTIIASFGSSSIALEDVEHVLIYNATELDTVPPNCFTAGVPTGSNTTDRECNHYDAAYLLTMDATSVADFGLLPDGTEDPSNTTGACLSSDVDKNFCPLLRNRTPNPNTEYVGVWIQVRHGYTTGILPWESVTLEDKTVMGIEPLGTL